MLNVIEVVLGSIKESHDEYCIGVLWFENFSIGVFTVEYLLRLWFCVDLDEQDERPHWKQRLAYFCKPFALIGLPAILPSYLSLFVNLDLRFLRVVGIPRIFKLTRYSMAMQLIFAVFREEMESFITAFTILLTLLIIAASGIYLIEQNIQLEGFGTIPDAM